MTHKQPDPFVNLLPKIRKYIDSEKYKVSKHAIARQEQRAISTPDAIYVLIHGFHEESKSLYDTNFQTWKYAIRGKTLDGIDIRVVVALEEDMMIITVIRITKGKI